MVASLRDAMQSLTKLNGMVWTEVTEACRSEAVRSTVSMRSLNKQALAQAQAINTALATADVADAAKQQHHAVTQAKALSAAAVASSATIAAGQQGPTSVHALVPGAGAGVATAAGQDDGQQPGKDRVGSRPADGRLAFGAKAGTVPMADGEDGLSDGADVHMGSARAVSHAQAGVLGRQHSGAMQRWLHGVTRWGFGRTRPRGKEADVEAGDSPDKVSDEEKVSLDVTHVAACTVGKLQHSVHHCLGCAASALSDGQGQMQTAADCYASQKQILGCWWHECVAAVAPGRKPGRGRRASRGSRGIVSWRARRPSTRRCPTCACTCRRPTSI